MSDNWKQEVMLTLPMKHFLEGRILQQYLDMVTLDLSKKRFFTEFLLHFVFTKQS